MGKFSQLVGQTIGILTVNEYIPGQGRKGEKKIKPMCICICECGRERRVMATHLMSGHTRGCGFCLKQGVTKNVKHGGALGGEAGPTYACWISMKTRCTNSKAVNYCERWLNSFENFIQDMGERPSLKHSLDRYPNMNGIYEPGNARWATPKQQQRNRRNTFFVIYEGNKVALSELTEKFNLNHGTILSRVRRGWSLEKALVRNKADNDLLIGINLPGCPAN